MSKRVLSDEKYVLDLLSEILGKPYEHQKRFDTLRGDHGKDGRTRPLPVDGYFSARRLIVEYRERQHGQAVPIMDGRPTVSGVTRGEQRSMYDARRAEWVKAQGFEFLVISYSDLEHNRRGRLRRNRERDLEALQSMLSRLPSDRA